MTEAFVCDAARTPIGRFGGALAYVRADDLAAHPIRALLARNDLDPAAIDEVILGCANQAGEDNRNLARMAGLLAGLPVSAPGSTINRLCASGADAVGTAARAIRSGEIELAIAGGAENMTRAPLVMGKAETAFQRTARLEDTTIGWRFVNPKMLAAHGTHSMPETAENVAEAHGVGREDQDRFALQSQARAAAAQANGFLEPKVMGIGPVPASRKLMARLGLAIRDFDVVEINEAFASQVIASLRELGVEPADPRVNRHGGAIALGQPLGMSGARLVMTAVHALERRGGRRALVTMCVGVGQGVSIALERI